MKPSCQTISKVKGDCRRGSHFCLADGLGELELFVACRFLKYVSEVGL